MIVSLRNIVGAQRLNIAQVLNQCRVRARADARSCGQLKLINPSFSDSSLVGTYSQAQDVDRLVGQSATDRPHKTDRALRETCNQTCSAYRALHSMLSHPNYLFAKAETRISLRMKEKVIKSRNEFETGNSAAATAGHHLRACYAGDSLCAAQV